MEDVRFVFSLQLSKFYLILILQLCLKTESRMIQYYNTVDDASVIHQNLLFFFYFSDTEIYWILFSKFNFWNYIFILPLQWSFIALQMIQWYIFILHFPSRSSMTIQCSFKDYCWCCLGDCIGTSFHPDLHISLIFFLFLYLVIPQVQVLYLSMNLNSFLLT